MKLCGIIKHNMIYKPVLILKEYLFSLGRKSILKSPYLLLVLADQVLFGVFLSDIMKCDCVKSLVLFDQNRLLFLYIKLCLKGILSDIVMSDCD